MSNPTVLFGSMVASFVVSKVTTKIFDSPMLGAIAGAAAGGFVANAAGAAAGAGEAGMVGGSVETPVSAASSLGGQGALANYENIMGEGFGSSPQTGAQTFAATEQPDVMVNARPIDASGNVVQPSTAPGAAITPPAKPGLLGISNNEWLKFGGDILSGVAEQDAIDAQTKRYEDMTQLERDKLAMEQQRYNDQSAYGITRDGRQVPLNVAEQLDELNKNTQGTSLNRLNNVRGLLRAPGGYASGYGRFGRQEETR